MIPRIVSLITACCAAALVATGCSSSPSVAGGSDNPDFLYGTASLPDSAAAKGARLEAVPVHFGGFDSDSSTIVRGVCDSLGRFSLPVVHGESYNILLLHESSGYRGMIHEVVSQAPHDTIIPVTLSPTATFKIQIPDSIASGTVYLQGTTRSLPMQNAVAGIDGYHQLIFDSLPEGPVPPVVLQRVDSSAQIIAVGQSVVSGGITSIVVSADNADVKPLSDFRIIVGISKGTESQFSSSAEMYTAIDSIVSRVNEAFADPRISTVIHYSVDSVFLFADSTIDSQNLPLDNRYAIRLLLTNTDRGTFGNWVNETRTINHEYTDSAKGGLLSDASFGYMMWGFGLSRGCYYSLYSNVDAAKNPINGAGFSVPPTYLSGRIDSGWSAYDIGTINAYGSSIGIQPFKNYTTFPSVIGIDCVDSTGKPVVSRRVNVYPSEYYSGAVDSVAGFSGVTDNAGQFILSTNPYLMGKTSVFVNSNLLIEVDGSPAKTYAWLPLYEAGTAYFNGATGIWYKRIVVSN